MQAALGSSSSTPSGSSSIQSDLSPSQRIVGCSAYAGLAKGTGERGPSSGVGRREKVAAAHPDDSHVGALYAESLMDLHPWDLCFAESWKGADVKITSACFCQPGV